MANGYHTDKITVGALIRRQIRVALDTQGISYKEHKGLFDSIFVITTTYRNWQTINKWVTIWEDSDG